MKPWGVVILAIGLALATASCAARNERGSTRWLNGTLHVTDSTTRQFRIAGVDEIFTAPVGTPLEALDGRTVQVEVSPRGHVERIDDGGPSSE